MNHTTHHDGCECFTKKMAELESKLAKAREALEHIAQTTKTECCDRFYWSDDKIAREALNEISPVRDD